MSAETRSDESVVEGMGGVSTVGLVGSVGFLAVSALGATMGLWKLLVVGWVAFVAMAGAAVLGRRAARTRDAFGLV